MIISKPSLRLAGLHSFVMMSLVVRNDWEKNKIEIEIEITRKLQRGKNFDVKIGRREETANGMGPSHQVEYISGTVRFNGRQGSVNNARKDRCWLRE